MENNILVSIECLTYNHVRFIRQCLDGFLMQKTNFKFEVLIHDDASTDGTTDIIKEYEQKYPDIIKPIYQTENQWSKGINVSKVYNLSRVKGKYVALCEGDDYWTDPYKLQKQVYYLENHPECSICFHPVKVIWENNEHKSSIYPSKSKLKWKDRLKLNDLLKVNFIQTNSVVYRWRHDICEKFPDGILPGDWYLHLLHAQVGDIAFLAEVMAVYRKHDGGIWFDEKNRHLKYAKNEIKFYDSIYRNITNCSKEYLYSIYIPKFKEIVDSLYKNGEFVLLQEIYENNNNIYNLAMQCGNIYELKYKKYKNLFILLLFVSLFLLLISLIFIFGRVC